MTETTCHICDQPHDGDPRFRGLCPACQRAIWAGIPPHERREANEAAERARGLKIVESGNE